MININGYYLNRYTNVVTLIRDMMEKATLARTKMEAKTILRLMRYLGVNHLMYDAPMSEHLEMNIPSKGLKNHLYQIHLYNNELVVMVTPVSMRESAVIIRPIMLAKDIITKKSIVATVRDLF